MPDHSVIHGVELDEYVVVKKGNGALRDMYGGVVRIECHWKCGGSSGMAAVELDGDAITHLKHALNTRFRESEADYTEANR